MSSRITVSRAEVVDIGQVPPGFDSDIVVAMEPAEDTTGWAITADISATRDGTPIVTLTTAGGDITVGQGDDNEQIVIDMTNADTVTLRGQHWLHVRRTDSGERDRYAIATMNFKGPPV